MSRRVTVLVPLPCTETMQLLHRAADALQISVVRFDGELGHADLHVDFQLRALSTFRVRVHAQAVGEHETELHFTVTASLRLGGFSGVGQSERIAWEIVGKMQQLLDPVRYASLEWAARPPRHPLPASSSAPPARHG